MEIKEDEYDIDTYRRWHLACAEFVDAWRLVPRAVVAGYGWMLYQIIIWYMTLESYLPSEFTDKVDTLTPEQIQALMVQAPSTQHAALVTAVIGISAAIFAFYSNSGRPWSRGFTSWKYSAPPSLPRGKVDKEEHSSRE